MAKSYRYSDEEIKFIELNWRVKTDREIARILGRNEKGIERQRKSRGWIKEHGRPSEEDIRQHKEEIAKQPGSLSSFSMAAMDKNQRIEIYKENFARNIRSKHIVTELHPDETEYYKHKYIEFMDSVDTMTIQEEDSLHHMVMADIAVSRIRRKIRDMEEAAQEEDASLIYGLYDLLDKAEKKFVEYQRVLRVTREGRLKENKEEKETFSTVVKLYRNRQARDEIGRQAGLMEIYKDKCTEEMKSSRYLLGE